MGSVYIRKYALQIVFSSIQLHSIVRLANQVKRKFELSGLDYTSATQLAKSNSGTFENAKQGLKKPILCLFRVLKLIDPSSINKKLLYNKNFCLTV